jgi:16S rRNA (guanine(966)-N(2))-methyltransferase RsmD
VPVGTRPTSDRLRETLFNILGPRVIESVFLDAYAGTGAVGIEAISRGAAFVHFVERSEAAVNAIRSNLESLNVTERFQILDTDLDRALGGFLRESVRFGIVFLDPPYGNEDGYQKDLLLLGAGSCLMPGACVVAEHSRHVELPESAGRLHRFRTRQQGSSILTFYEAEGS